MKRFWLCLGIFAVLLAVCAASLGTLYQVKTDLMARMDAIEEAVSAGDTGQMQTLSRQLEQSWRRTEQRLVRLVRHTDLDLISLSAAKLSALARPETLPLFHAELDAIRSLVLRVWESELPLLHNLL